MRGAAPGGLPADRVANAALRAGSSGAMTACRSARRG